MKKEKRGGPRGCRTKLMNSFKVICTRVWRNALRHLPSWTLNSTTKERSIELQTSNVWYLLTFLFCFFQPLQVLVLVLFHQRLAPHTGMASSVAGFGLIFQLSENRDAPDPLWHSFISFTTCLGTFEILFLVRSIKSSGNKQRKQCFTTNNKETRPSVVCER